MTISLAKIPHCTYCGGELVKDGVIYRCTFCTQFYTEKDIEYIKDNRAER